MQSHNDQHIIWKKFNGTLRLPKLLFAKSITSGTSPLRCEVTWSGVVFLHLPEAKRRWEILNAITE